MNDCGTVTPEKWNRHWLEMINHDLKIYCIFATSWGVTIYIYVCIDVPPNNILCKEMTWGKTMWFFVNITHHWWVYMVFYVIYWYWWVYMVLLGFITQQLFASPVATSAIPVMVIPKALMAKDQVCQTLEVCDFSSKAPREPCFSLLRAC